MIFFSVVLFLNACNSSSGRAEKTNDSLQQLLSSIRDSIRMYPEDPRPRYNLAIVLQDAGRFQEAVAALDSLNISQPDSVNPRIYYDYLFKRAELLELAGDTIKAIKTLELFVMPGELTTAGLRLANLYAETKDPRTISFCDTQIKNDATGKDPNPSYLKGVYYYNISDFGNAIASFNECIRRDYTFIDAYMEKGRIQYKLQQYAEAINTYDLALSVSNTFADAFFWKAKCQEALGQKQEAKLNYQRAYGLDKTLTEARDAAKGIIN